METSGFLDELAGYLHGRYGDDVASLTIVLPNRRARLFLNDALAARAARPLWEPAYATVDELMEELGGLRTGDRTRLVTELYAEYSRWHDEPFDSFYFWGEMLLADFDSVDKYLVNADVLLRNIVDLKELEGDMSWLAPEQREIVARFWKSFGRAGEYSDEQRSFLAIWNTLAPIYHGFRARLAAAGIAYGGMMYRAAAEKIKAGEVAVDTPKRMVVAGFNALSECEKRLFDHLAANHDTEFFWDSDDYYLLDADQEAGLFMRENVRRWPQKTVLGRRDNFSRDKRITVAALPSDALQAKYVTEYLTRIAEEQGAPPGRETAVVLTDENLLMPVLHSIPDSVADVNVTMGYPLKNTLEYSFVERLVELRMRQRRRGSVLSFYHADVRGMLSHPFFSERDPRQAASMLRDVAEKQRVYVDARDLTSGPFAGAVFGGDVERWSELADYVIGVLALVDTSHGGGDAREKYERRRRYEFLSLIEGNIIKLRNSLEESGVGLSLKTFASLLRRMLQNVRVPYEGEPLRGVQIMGILETRNLDFRNVLVLSMNDDTFPGSPGGTPSFIPHNLRHAYGLPTPQHHEGVYAYYFYRLLQRAANVHLAYSSRADERSSGEQSRYIYQLAFESGHALRHETAGVDVAIEAAAPTVVAKDGAVMERLARYSAPGGAALSPTAFFAYVQCPLKFYYRSIAGLRTGEEIAEEVDAPMLGSVLHRAMELLYRPLVDVPRPGERIGALAGSDSVAAAVDAALREVVPGVGESDEDWPGNVLLARDIVIKYVNDCILAFDARADIGAIIELEKPIECEFRFALHDGGEGVVRFGGLADRVEMTTGGRLRVVDYKTGGRRAEFDGVESLFVPDTARLNPAVQQIMLYCMMLSRMTGADAEPALYFVRFMNAPGYTPNPVDKSTGEMVESYRQQAAGFEQGVAATLAAMMDQRVPFTQCSDAKTCLYCDFNAICRR